MITKIGSSFHLLFRHDTTDNFFEQEFSSFPFTLRVDTITVRGPTPPFLNSFNRTVLGLRWQNTWNSGSERMSSNNVEFVCKITFPDLKAKTGFSGFHIPSTIANFFSLMRDDAGQNLLPLIGYKSIIFPSNPFVLLYGTNNRTSLFSEKTTFCHFPTSKLI